MRQIKNIVLKRYLGSFAQECMISCIFPAPVELLMNNTTPLQTTEGGCQDGKLSWMQIMLADSSSRGPVLYIGHHLSNLHLGGGGDGLPFQGKRLLQNDVLVSLVSSTGDASSLVEHDMRAENSSSRDCNSGLSLPTFYLAKTIKINK